MVVVLGWSYQVKVLVFVVDRVYDRQPSLFDVGDICVGGEERGDLCTCGGTESELFDILDVDCRRLSLEGRLRKGKGACTHRRHASGYPTTGDLDRRRAGRGSPWDPSSFRISWLRWILERERLGHGCRRVPILAPRVLKGTIRTRQSLGSLFFFPSEAV